MRTLARHRRHAKTHLASLCFNFIQLDWATDGAKSSANVSVCGQPFFKKERNRVLAILVTGHLADRAQVDVRLDASLHMGRCRPLPNWVAVEDSWILLMDEQKSRVIGGYSRADAVWNDTLSGLPTVMDDGVSEHVNERRQRYFCPVRRKREAKRMKTSGRVG